MFKENDKNIKNGKTIISTGFSVTAILTTIVAVPIGLTIFERSYGSQVYGNVDKNQVVNLKTETTFSEEDFINAVNNLKIFDKYKNLSAKTALALAKNPSYSFNFLQAFDFSPITKHRFRVVLNIENASVSGSEVKNVVVFAHSDQLKLTYSKKTDLRGFAATDTSDGNLVNFQIDLAKSNLTVSGSKSANLIASEVAFKVDNDFQTAYKKTRSRSQAFSDALLENGLSYNLVNNLGLPTILEKGYVLAPKTSLNEKAKQEKLVKIGEDENKRVENLLKVQNLVFKNLDDKNGTLSITFELFDKSGKLVQEFDFPITGIKKLEYDVKKAEKDILAKVKEFVQVKPFVQLALVRDKLSLAETIYKSDTNPANLAKVLAKFGKSQTPKAEKTPVSVQEFQDSGQSGTDAGKSSEKPGEKPSDAPKTEPKTPEKSKETEKVEINREDFSSFFNLKSKVIPVSELDSYFIEVNSINFAKNLTKEQTDKLLQDQKVSLEVNFSVKKQLNVQAPYLESEFVKSNYSPVLRTSLSRVGKGNNSKVVLLDLGSFKTNIDVQLDYNENQRKLLSSVLEKDPEKLEKLENLENLNSESSSNFDLLSTTFKFRKNPNEQLLTLEHVKSLVSEVVENAKNGKTFNDVAATLHFLDRGFQPKNSAELENYKKLYASKFDKEESKPKPEAEAAKPKPKPEPETAKPSENSSQTAGNAGNAGTNGSTESSSSSSASTPESATSASSTSSSVSAVATTFQEAKESSPKTSKDDEKEIIKNWSFEGLGVKLWKFLQKSNYSVLGDTNIKYDVLKKNKEQIDVVLSFSPKTGKPSDLQNAQVVFSIKGLDDQPGYDFLRSYNPTVFFDFRKNHERNSTGQIDKISALNRNDAVFLINKSSATSDNNKEKQLLNSVNQDGISVEKAIKIEQKKTAPAENSKDQKNETTVSPSEDSLILKKGVILVAFSVKNVSDGKKHHLFSSNEGLGLFIKKQKMKDNTHKFILGIEPNPKEPNTPPKSSKSTLALISGLEGQTEANSNLFIDDESGSSDKPPETLISLNFGAPRDPDPFRQRNINKTDVDDFDFIKENHLLFLTIIKKDDKYDFWLTSKNAKNPYTQKIASFVDLSVSRSHKKNLNWSNLGPNPQPEQQQQQPPQQQQHQNLSPRKLNAATITFKGFAVYDSTTLVNNHEAVSELTNHFIREFKD
ncbi:Uncharacterised protein [Mesomycoplasma dispar]|uniref:Uncharacterized protein n=1 Tax=Mesomycoplasma dispar TaxID=86660 RepID=A0AAJ5TCY4_9BACT|nr:P110/LppT family adhesin N-terminal domain [Mesomycoplasma dispar]AJR12492.1 hypothetical protein MDIS_04020 [Mesomycoplasma dispar]VEU62747.1 Uncharacterised protein [Mesomycoplasma dispar]